MHGEISSHQWNSTLLFYLLLLLLLLIFESCSSFSHFPIEILWSHPSLIVIHIIIRLLFLRFLCFWDYNPSIIFLCFLIFFNLFWCLFLCLILFLFYLLLLWLLFCLLWCSLCLFCYCLLTLFFILSLLLLIILFIVFFIIFLIFFFNIIFARLPLFHRRWNFPDLSLKSLINIKSMRKCQ